MTRQLADSTWSFSVPRFVGGATTIGGGTKEAGDFELTPRRDTRELLLREFVATYPPILTSGAVERAAVSDGEGITSNSWDPLGNGLNDSVEGNPGDFKVIADIVGWRPTRKGGIGLGTQRLGNRAGVVVHAYGLGGMGWERLRRQNDCSRSD